MTHTTPLSDILIIGATATFTTFLCRQSRPYLARAVAGWDKLPTHVQDRLAMEVASVPARITLGIVILPVIWSGFAPLQEWRPSDTEACLMIWSVSPISSSHSPTAAPILTLASSAILTGTYAPNLLVSRSRLSMLHYTMPLFLLLAIRIFASDLTPSDALICRIIMSFVFFGACLGGLATSLLTFCFHCRDVWALCPDRAALRQGYWMYTAIGLPILTIATAWGHWYCAAYMYWWIGDGRVVYGAWSHVLVGWAVLDSLIEVRFLWWFHGYEGRFWGKVVKVCDGENGHEVEKLRDGIWWVPKWRFRVMKAVVGAWVLVMMPLFMK